MGAFVSAEAGSWGLGQKGELRALGRGTLLHFFRSPWAPEEALHFQPVLIAWEVKATFWGHRWCLGWAADCAGLGHPLY